MPSCAYVPDQDTMRAPNARSAPAASERSGTLAAAPAAVSVDPSSDPLSSRFRDYGRKRARELSGVFRNRRTGTDSAASGETKRQATDAADDRGAPAQDDVRPSFQRYGERRAAELRAEFFKGRYNRSRARLPENRDRWRGRPDIANPGPDLANFPNSAFTLPQGRAYIELSPFTYYGTAATTPAQYNAEFLLRYGVTDDLELRLFGNGPSRQGGRDPGWGFSPIAFDTKIQLWLEKPDYFLPAAGLEAYIQTEWLGNAAFNAGTQPSFTVNFDQSLPFEIDLEYNLGATRVQDGVGDNVWEFSFQWALQRDFFNKNFALFIHGFVENAGLPRVPMATLAVPRADMRQNAVGAGFVWTASSRLAIYGQVSGGTTKFTPQPIGLLGLAMAF